MSESILTFLSLLPSSSPSCYPKPSATRGKQGGVGAAEADAAPGATPAPVVEPASTAPPPHRAPWRRRRPTSVHPSPGWREALPSWAGAPAGKTPTRGARPPGASPPGDTAKAPPPRPPRAATAAVPRPPTPPNTRVILTRGGGGTRGAPIHGRATAREGGVNGLVIAFLCPPPPP